MPRTRSQMARFLLSLARSYLLNTFCFLGGMTTVWVLITGTAVIEPHQIYVSLAFGLLAITTPWRNLMQTRRPPGNGHTEAQ